MKRLYLEYSKIQRVAFEDQNFVRSTALWASESFSGLLISLLHLALGRIFHCWQFFPAPWSTSVGGFWLRRLCSSCLLHSAYVRSISRSLRPIYSCRLDTPSFSRSVWYLTDDLLALLKYPFTTPSTSLKSSSIAFSSFETALRFPESFLVS